MMIKATRTILSALALTVLAAGTAFADPIIVKMSTYTPPTHYLTMFWTEVAKEMTEASDGKAIVEMYHSESLGKSTEQWEIVEEGLAEMSIAVSAIFYPNRLPASLFVELPFFSQDITTSVKVINKLIERDLLQDEFKTVKLLTAYATPPAQLFSNRHLTSVDDFKGLRVVGQGPVWTRTWSLLGAQGIAMGWPDIYLGLERGTIDAAPGNWAASKSWKWAEVAKYPTEIGIMGGFFNAVIMNQATWEKLPQDVQVSWAKILTEVPLRIAAIANESEEQGREFAREAGREIAQFPADQRQNMAHSLLPIWQDWLDRNKADGKPAEEIYKAYVEVMKEAGEPVVMQLPGLY